MDSYEYYLLFHIDKPAFVNALSERSRDNEQLITALERLIVNEKEICDEIKENVLSMVTSDNNKVDWILGQIVTNTEPLKAWIEQNELESNPMAFFRVVRLLTEKTSSGDAELELFKGLASKILQYVYREAVTERPEAIACLRSMMKQQQVSKWVTEEVSQKLDRTDPVSLKNLCYFFGEMCNNDCINNESEIILKYFENSDLSARKPGLFLIKTLIEFKKLSNQDEESFKKFIVVVETLEEAQHLITPTLELIKQFNFSEKFQDFWFVTCRMVLRHESSLVKQWALNFILRATPPVPFNEKQTLEILDAFNSTSLLEIHESLCGEPLRVFIVRNLNFVFRNLIEINWTSFTFYRVLEVIAENISRIAQNDREFSETLRLQTEIIPKRIKNHVIRNGVQIQFSKIATSVVKTFGLNSWTLPIVCNVFSIGNQHKLLEPCFENVKTENFLYLFPPFVENEEFFKFALVASSLKCSFEEMEQKCSLSKTYSDGLMIYLMSEVRERLGNHPGWPQETSVFMRFQLRGRSSTKKKLSIDNFLNPSSGATIEECNHDDLLKILKTARNLIMNWRVQSSKADLVERLTHAIFNIDGDKFQLLKEFIEVVFAAAKLNFDAPDLQLRDLLAFAVSKMNQKEKTRVVFYLIQTAEETFDIPSALKDFIGELLIEQIKETPMLTKEQL